MKAILMSVRPEWVSKILNGEKTIEIRKRFPNNYVGWVYIYVTKGKGYCYHAFEFNACTIENTKFIPMTKCNGKVVARFWCDKVDNYANGSKIAFENGTYILGTNADFEAILKPSCLTEDELYDYCEDLSFKAIHITKLEIFNKPKDVGEFFVQKGFVEFTDVFTDKTTIEPNLKPLTRAPQSWCYVEV